ncbi:MAG TPA: hypothetical protein VK568_08830 [Thermodesulfobacteriota bacterium]|jgi:hypothetical protein|nr:hypothetical protein [Thermodesulfobacteriota bacterium]
MKYKERLSGHPAPLDAMVYLLGGETEVSISAKPFRLKAWNRARGW